MNRPRRLATVPPPDPADETAPRRRPDALVPMAVLAFCLGVVVTAVSLLALRTGGVDTVPAVEHQAVVTQLAAERAARDAADALTASQGDALDAADVLARRLVAALDTPPVSASDLTALRREASRQTERIERVRDLVRIVRVPTPAPARDRPQAARQDPPAGPPPATAPRCSLELLGVCLAR